ncbi:MAG: YitT family protein [Thermotogaceae bacterium]|nr:YitT family protein [Thermotogaceae bacterium]
MNKGIVVREYILTTVGLFITALGLDMFLIPNGIAAGGVSGLSMILSHLTSIPVGIWMYILNAILFTIAFITIGFDFSAKTIYSTFMLNFFVDLFDRIVPIWKYAPPYIEGEVDHILAVLFGVMLTAIGMAITFSQNSSTGGTDIIARIFNKYFGTAIGTTLMIVDFVIGFSSAFSFGVEKAMYAILAIIINGMMIDFVLHGIEMSSKVIIFSEKSDKVIDFILNELKRGATKIPSIGAYTGKEKILILTVVRRRELAELIHFLRRVDPKAFVIIGEVRQVLGEGFREINKAL